MRFNPSGIILAIVWSPLLILAFWSYRRPQNSFRRIWARHFSLYLFLVYLILVAPGFFIGQSETLGPFLGTLVGLALIPSILITFISARIRASKLQSTSTPTAVLPGAEAKRPAG